MNPEHCKDFRGSKVSNLEGLGCKFKTIKDKKGLHSKDDKLEW